MGGGGVKGEIALFGAFPLWLESNKQHKIEVSPSIGDHVLFSFKTTLSKGQRLICPSKNKIFSPKEL